MNAELAVRRDPTTVIALADDYWLLAQRIAGTEFVPKSLRNRPEAVLAALLSGAERGLGAMESLRSVHVIEGVPSLSAEAMRALVFAAGHDIQILETTAVKATVVGRRAGADTTSPPFTWTMDKARRARLSQRDNWTKYPEAMLLARASADLCRAWFPDVVAGLGITEVAVDETESEVVPATTKRSRVRGSGAIGPAVAPVPAPVASATEPDEPEQTPRSLEDPERITPDEVLDGIPGSDVPAWGEPDEPEPTGTPDATLARRIHAWIGELYPNDDNDTRDRYRHALCAITTRGRAEGPIASSAALDMDEQLRLSDILAKIRGGQATVADGPDGTVELRAGGGWVYVVGLDPVRVDVRRGPEA